MNIINEIGIVVYKHLINQAANDQPRSVEFLDASVR